MVESPKKSTYKNTIQNINYFLTLVVAFWMPLNEAYYPAILGLWLAFWLFEGNFKTRFGNFKDVYLIMAFLLYFLITVVAVTYSNNKNDAWFEVQKKLSFAFFPFIFLGSNEIIKKNVRAILMAFVLGSLASSFYCIGNAFYQNLQFTYHGIVIKYWAYDDFAGWPFWKVFNDRYNLFSYIYLSVFKHPTYFSLYILFSICIIYFFILKNKNSSKRKKFLASILIMYFLVFVFFLQSRAGILTSVFMVIFIIVLEIIRNYSRKLILISSFVVILLFGLLVTNERIIRNIKEISEIIKVERIEYKNSDTRFNSWRAAVAVIKENFIIGTAPADVEAELVIKYKQYGQELAASEKLNAHNQYLESFAGLGLTGIILLLVILFKTLLAGIKTKNYLLILFLSMIMINFLFESMLNRMAGFLFFMFFIGLLYFTGFQFKSSDENTVITTNG
ncbi:MAG: O-antigen ligase family protein [Bacteroidales bacterium]